MPRPLLSLVEKGDPWPALNRRPGINAELRNNFSGRLYKLSTIEASGVPSLFNHPFVVYTKLNSGDGDTFRKFSTLIKGIFLGVISLRNVADQLGQLGNVAKKFKSNLNDFKVLEWKNQPIGGIYPDCLVFHGARFEAGEYGDDMRWDGLIDEVQRMENRLGSDIVRALFKKWVDEIENILRLPVGDNGPLWFQRLSLVKSNWTTAVQPPVTAFNDFTKVIFNVQVSNHTPNLVSIPIRHITKNIFCEKVIKFDNGKMPDLSVKSEFLNLINTVDRIGNTYFVTLKGWTGAITWTPQEIIEGHKASILIWPTFKANGWGVNYAYFHPSAKLREFRPSIKLLNSDGKNTTPLKEIREEITGEKAGCRTNSPITHIEIICEGKPVGIFSDNRNIFKEQAITTCAISLDFGTCNTALGIKLGRTDVPFSIHDESVDILGMNYYLQDKEEKMEAYKRSFWLPTYFPGMAVNYLPSDILFTTDTIRHGGVANLSEPLRNFSIPAPLFERDGAEKCIISGFKWEDDAAFKGVDRSALVKSYLKMVMHMALATLRGKMNAQTVSVVATYPLAYDKNRYDLYKNWLTNELFNELSAETGIDVVLETVNSGQNLKEFVGESYAGKAHCSVPSPALAFVVDIGGGTTDIALARGQDLLAVDSIHYAGNTYIKYLAGNNLGTPTPDLESIKIEMITIQKTMREHGIAYLFAGYDETLRRTAEAALNRFFSGLFEYLYLFLSAYNKSGDVIHLFPIGNGWKFVEGLSANNRIRAYVEEWFKNRSGREGKNISIIVDTNIEFGPKEAVAIGAIKIARLQRYEHPDLKHPIKAPGTDGVRIVSKTGREKVLTKVDCIPTQGLGFKSEDNPEFDTTGFINLLETVGLKPTRREISLSEISSRLNTACNMPDMMCEISTGAGLSVVRSIFGRFLEKIYPELYL